MNVYDFDKTIFYPDSTATFLRYTFRKHPGWMMESATSMAIEFPNAILNDDYNAMKEKSFLFLKYLTDVDSYVEEFWENNLFRIEKWYLKQKKPDDVVISASPEFMLKPLTDMLGVNLIATPMDPYSGNIMGLNNKGEEKVRRFRLEYGDSQIDEFYSDSDSDLPLARIAVKAYKVTDHHPHDWIF